MRYRYRLSLYDDSDLDKEIVDYLSRLPSSHRKQEMLRTFIRAGFSTVAKKTQDDIAYLDGLSDQQKSLLVRGSPYMNNSPQTSNNIINKSDSLNHRHHDYGSPIQKSEIDSNPPSPGDGYANSSDAMKVEEGSPDDPVDFMSLLK